MNKFLKKINRRIRNVQNFGLRYEVEDILIKIGVLKEKSFKNIMNIQKFYENLNPEKYPVYLKEWYKDATGHDLDLKNPTRFTEKIQWMKLYDVTPIKTQLADKYLARFWVADKVGEQYLIPFYGAWDRFDEIDFDTLPDSFIMKCNHGSGMDIKVKDKAFMDNELMKKKFDQWLKIDFSYFMKSFELHYKDIPRKIIAEKFMVDGNKPDLQDYKFYCFEGMPVYCQVIGSRSTGETIDFYDMEWKHMPFVGLNLNVSNSKEVIAKPKTFEEMVNVASILSEGFSFVRVDLYEIEGKVYFGEMTFTPASGGGGFRPDEIDFELGKMLKVSSDEQ